MFNVGDLIVYSAHGICQIDDICEKTYLGVTKNYYVLHPLQDSKLKISSPVDSDKVIMLDIIHRDEAEEIIESFKEPGISWIEMSSHRNPIYFDIVKQGNRKEISKVLNTLIRKKQEAAANKKKLSDQDSGLLNLIQSILFSELAMSLNTTFDAINEKVNRYIKENEY